MKFNTNRKIDNYNEFFEIEIFHLKTESYGYFLYKKENCSDEIIYKSLKISGKDDFSVMNTLLNLSRNYMNETNVPRSNELIDSVWQSFFSSKEQILFQ